MDKFITIKYKIEKAEQKKIKTILKKYKLSQKKVIDELSAVILPNWNSDGISVITNDFVASVQTVIRDNLNQLQADEIETVTSILSNAYSKAVTDTAKLVGVSIDYNLVNPAIVKAAIDTPIDGLNFSQRIWKNTNKLANRIYDDVLDCVRNGTRPDEIARKIKNDYGSTAYQSKRLVNTELARAVNQGQMDTYRNSKVVESVMYMATLETNTCDTCGKLDGKKFKIDSAPTIPIHPNCRCCYIPIVDDYTPSQRADNQTKTNIDYTTFEEWNYKL